MDEQIGDCKIKRSLDKVPDSRESRFSYPSLVEAQIRKLKLSLENWKEIVLNAKKVFFWEKQWHPSALIGSSTVLFMFLWLLDPSILTVISVFGLVFTICDYLIPTFASSFFKAEKWSTRKENEFEEICTNIILYKARLELAWGKYYRLKTTNRKMYFAITIFCLGLLTWIGCTFNNLFLAYLLVTFFLLLPGLEHNGYVRRGSEYLSTIFGEILKPKLPEKRD